jgi:hypothetical protein
MAPEPRANQKLFRVMSPVEEVEGPLSKNQKFLMGQRKSCVPDTFQLGAIPDARAFLACRKINNLSVIMRFIANYSDVQGALAVVAREYSISLLSGRMS